jgi:hypothetical protein
VRAAAGLTLTPLLALTLVLGASRAGFVLGPACPCGAGAAEAACDTPPRLALSKPLSFDRTLHHLAWSRVALHPPLPPPSIRTAPPACLPACRPSGRRQWRAASGRGPGVFCRHCVLVQPAGGGRGAGGQHYQRGVMGKALCRGWQLAVPLWVGVRVASQAQQPTHPQRKHQLVAGSADVRDTFAWAAALPALWRRPVTDMDYLLPCMEFSTAQHSAQPCVTGLLAPASSKHAVSFESSQLRGASQPAASPSKLAPQPPPR